jgi:hypothetical protein
MSLPDSLPAYLSLRDTCLTDDDDDDDDEDLIRVEALATLTDEDSQEFSGLVAANVVSRNSLGMSILQDGTQASPVESSLDSSAAVPPVGDSRNSPPSPPTGTPSSPVASPIDAQVPTSTDIASTPVRNGCQDTFNKFINTQDTQSPSKHEHTDAIRESDMGKVLDIRGILLKELAGKIVEVQVSWAESLYKDIPRARTAKIKGFLRTSDQYHNGRWVNLPKVAPLENRLYGPFTDIINSILRWANLSGTRKAIDTHVGYLKHGGQTPTSHRSSPDIAIKGSGPSFTRPTNGREVGYPNMVSFFDAKRDKDVRVNSDDNHVSQLGVYGR